MTTTINNNGSNSRNQNDDVPNDPCLNEQALRRDPPALVVADRRASAAFRACSKLGLRCVVNSAGLLGDLDRPPSSIPAPYTGVTTAKNTYFFESSRIDVRDIHANSF